MAQNNIVILAGRFGMGHYCAADAIKREILQINPRANITVIDFIDYMFPKLNKLIYGSFNFMVNKFSYVYNLLNTVTSKFNDIPLKTAISKATRALIDEYDADIFVSTMPVSSQYISAYKEKTGADIPLYTYITDITAHGEWIAKNTDCYFVGATSTKDFLISKGICADIIKITGIPVRPEFEAPCEFHRESRKKEVLIMGGGLGLIPSSSKLLGRLLAEDDIHVKIITGTNEKLRAELTSKYPSFEVIGFTDEVFRHMQKADLLITKSGGITTFEAIYTKTPLYIITPFLKQEIGNAEFIEQYGLGRVMWSKHTDAADDVISLLHNDAELSVIRENMKHMKNHLEPLCPYNLYAAAGRAV